MSVKAEHRYQAMLDRQSQERFNAVANNEIAKAGLWRDLMKQGHILTFKACNGRTITAGPYQTATGYHPGFALLGLKEEFHDSALGIAWKILSFCGRVKPIQIA